MIQFLVHSENDTVGIATVDIQGKEEVVGMYMDLQKDVKVRALEDIPLGHKIALKDHKVNDTVYKYGHDIGKVVSPIKIGQHVHIHNLKTKRW